MFDPKKYVYEFLFLSVISIIAYGFLKCFYKMNFLDKYLYVEKEKKQDFSIINTIKFILFHFFGYFFFGFIFTLDNFTAFAIKTFFVEYLLASIKNCEFKEMFSKDVMFTASISISIGLVSYYIGGLLHNYVYYKK